MNPANEFMIFFGLLDLFYDYPLDFGSIIHPQFFFLYMGYFDSVYGERVLGPNIDCHIKQETQYNSSSTKQRGNGPGARYTVK